LADGFGKPFPVADFVAAGFFALALAAFAAGFLAATLALDLTTLRAGFLAPDFAFALLDLLFFAIVFSSILGR
jgi:hypothetical protein